MKTKFIIIIFLTITAITIGLFLIPEKTDNFKVFTAVNLSGQILSLDMDNENHVVAGTNNWNHNGTLYYLDENGKIILQKVTPKIIGFVDISENGKYITTKGFELTDGRGRFYHNDLIEVYDNSLTKLWDFPKRELAHVPDDPDYTSYTIATDNDAYLSIFHEGILGFYNISGNLLWKQTIPGNVGIIDISDNKKIIAVASRNEFDTVDYDWNLNVFTADGTPMWAKSGIDYQTISSKAVAVSPNGNYIAIGLAAAGDEGLIQVFDKFGDLKWSDATDSVVSDVYFSPDEKNLVSSTNHGLRFYDIQGNLLWTKHETFLPRFSADYIIGTSPVEYHYVLKIMDYSGKIILDFKIDYPIRDVAISNDTSLIVIGTDSTSEFGTGTLYYFRNEN